MFFVKIERYLWVWIFIKGLGERDLIFVCRLVISKYRGMIRSSEFVSIKYFIY